MKKFISLFLSAVMISSTVASAASYTTQDALLDKVFGDGVSAERTMIETSISEITQKVNADVFVRNAGGSAFNKTAITVTKTSTEDFPLFDFQAAFRMSPVWDFFEECVERGERALTNSGVANAAEEIASVPVSGCFTIEVTVPKKLTVPNEIITGDNLYGFNNVAKQLFDEREARVWSEADAVNNKLVIKAYVKAGVTCQTISNFVASYGDDAFTLTAEDLKPTDIGFYKVKGAVTGEIYIGGDYSLGDASDPISVVLYDAIKNGTDTNNNLYATVTVEEEQEQSGSGSGSGSGGGGIYIPPVTNEQIKVEFDINGNRDLVPPIEGTKTVGVNYDGIIPPQFEGMIFDGWYLDPEFTTKLSGSQTVVTNLVVYGRYIIATAPVVFDDAHKAYIKGYPDGTVRPQGLITREEITTALFRLLKDDVAKSITTKSNNYTDVVADRWSNTSISSMSNGGYIKGYEDGSFRPANDITRAEFATLVLRFFNNSAPVQLAGKFTDVSGHWAEENVIKANALGLFNGYEDGSFRPDAYITRAEAMAVINRITIRRSTVNSFVGNYITWPDVAVTDWYYVDVIEATNTHDFERIDNLLNEKWTDVSYTDLIVG